MPYCQEQGHGSPIVKDNVPVLENLQILIANINSVTGGKLEKIRIRCRMCNVDASNKKALEYINRQKVVC